MTDPFLLISISSPSGTGKTTLCRRLLDAARSLRFSVSTTTRPRRGSEVDGQDYHFVTDDQFDQMVEAGEFVEWEEVHGHRYGTSRAEIERRREAGFGLLFDIDYRGSRRLKQAYPEAISLFLLPPSMAELERRIRGRGDVSEEQIQLRLNNAREEIRHHRQFDYIVVNDHVDRAFTDIEGIWRAERCRADRQAEAALRLLAEG